MTGVGIDFSFSRVAASSAKAAGYSFAASYLTDLDTSHRAKAWTASEVAAYRAAGLGVVAVWQGGGSDRTTAWRGGYDRGRRDARLAAQQAGALGRPEGSGGRPVYFAVDYDVRRSEDFAVLGEYFRGIASVFDPPNIGVYGGRATIEWAQRAGAARWFWQTGAWSDDYRVPGIHLYQRIPSARLGGYEIDIDDAMQADYGGWFQGGTVMPDMWIPGATRRPLGDTAPMNGGGKKVVWHITSNPGGNLKLANELGWFTSGGSGAAPHVLYSPITGETAQMYPADSRSKSVVAHNREGTYVIQVEIVFTTEKTDYRSLLDPRLTWKNFGVLLAWLRQLGIPDVWPVGRPAAFARQTASAAQWARSGHFGHNQIPDNDHVDPGPFPDIFARFPAGSASPQEDDVTPDELLMTEVPRAALPNGYVPRVWELLRSGSAFLEPAVADLKAEVAELAAKVETPAPVEVTVSGPELEAALDAKLDKLADMVVAKLGKRMEA
ncbi:DUF1906 domain-containing protein [Embleya sp. NPDC020630]|uniref:DUF1906 domain-containing protein n=1 Tax=Embleya sp. NPDC020630 TaxID=3363979 RepID=UPI003788B002